MSVPNYPALVLNADFMPLSLHPLSKWSFDRTMRNVMKDRVTVLETYPIEFKSPTFTYKPPSVVALKEYVKTPRKVVFNRLNIFLRDKFTCQYCGDKFKSNELTFDHVIPKSLGGKTNFTNIVSACVNCNTLKANKTNMKPIRAPYEPTESFRHTTLQSTENLHETWLDYLYWAGALEQG